MARYIYLLHEVLHEMQALIDHAELPGGAVKWYRVHLLCLSAGFILQLPFSLHCPSPFVMTASVQLLSASYDT